MTAGVTDGVVLWWYGVKGCVVGVVVVVVGKGCGRRV